MLEKLSKNLGKNNAQREYSYFVDNNKQEINKYHKSNNLTLYPNSDIETFIDKFEDKLFKIDLIIWQLMKAVAITYLHILILYILNFTK